MKTPPAPAAAARALWSRRGESDLGKALIDAEHPEEVIRALPAQTLYMVLQSASAEYAREVIAVADAEQYRAVLDFELWRRDRFSEERFWHWLALIDTADDLEPLDKLLDIVDRNLIGLLVCRWVDVVMRGEPTEAPPAEQSYTPDNGYTWLTFKLKDPEKRRLLAKLFAYLFETNVELFYQLVALPEAVSPSVLEEESYEAMTRRLLDLGIPEHETACRINAPLRPVEAARLLAAEPEYRIIEHVAVVEPLVYGEARLQRLSLLMEALRASDDPEALERFEREVTLIANAAVVFYRVPFSDAREVRALGTRIRGTMNIGLELAMEMCSHNPERIYDILGAQGLYRLGVSRLRDLRSQALSVPRERAAQVAEDDAAAQIVLAAAREVFPVMPCFLGADGSYRFDENGYLFSGFKAFESQDEIALVGLFIEERFEGEEAS